MNSFLKQIGKERFITNESGKIESVILPIAKYNKLIELIEDLGLGLAMKKSGNKKFLNREDALKFLEK